MYICISFSIRLYVFLNLYTCSCGNFAYVYTLHLHGWFFASKNADCALFQLGAALQIIIRNSCLWEKHFSKISWRGWHCGFMSVYVCPASWQACACALARRAASSDAFESMRLFIAMSRNLRSTPKNLSFEGRAQNQTFEVTMSPSRVC